MNGKSITYLIVLALFFMSLVSCSKSEKTRNISTDLIQNPISGSDQNGENDLPKIEFESKSHDFGIIVEGERVAWTYKFKNTGKSNLIITGHSATCGCTVPKYSKEPIPPGKEGKVEVVFNSTSKPGSQHKTVRIMTNGQPNVTILELTAEVYSPKKD